MLTPGSLHKYLDVELGSVERDFCYMEWKSRSFNDNDDLDKDKLITVSCWWFLLRSMKSDL